MEPFHERRRNFRRAAHRTGIRIAFGQGCGESCATQDAMVRLYLSINVGRQLWRDDDVTLDGHKESHAGGHRPNATATEHKNEHEHEIELEEPGYGRRGAGLRRDACRRHLWLTSSGATWGGASGYLPGDRHGRAGEHYRKRADDTPIRNTQFVGSAPPGGRLARYPIPQPTQPGDVRECQGTRQEQCAYERHDNRR